MQTTWIVVADSSRARIFEMQEPGGHLSEIEDLINTPGCFNAHDLRTDTKGRFSEKGDRDQGHTADPQVRPEEHEADMFSRTVTKYLSDSRNQHRYSRLRLVASPSFLGLIRNNMDTEVQKMVEEALPRDLSSSSARQIEEYLKERSE